MKRQLRLGRSEVIARLRDHAARFGAVSRASLDQQEREVLRSVSLCFRSLEAACDAAGVAVAMGGRLR